MSNWTETLRSTLTRDLSDHFGNVRFADMAVAATLWPDASPSEAEAFFLWNGIVKKYNDKDHPQEAACTAALNKFLTVNDRCGGWAANPTDSLDELLLGEFSNSLYKWFFLEDQGNVAGSLAEMFHAGGVGPGASIDARGFDFYTKVFDGPLSATKTDLLEFWRGAARKHPLWSNAEKTRSTRYTDRVVRGNKLSFVNKNVDTARCISTEPMVNMWFQKGLGARIEARTRSVFGVDLSTQPLINGSLARKGSEEGSFVTIDLESASDSIAISMLRQFAPREFVDWLMLLRSPTCQIPRKGRVDLNMIATMGNGFCFPLQTTVFCCVVSSVYRLLGIPMRSSDTLAFDPRGKNFGVFGDDIIVRTEASRWVLRLLHLLGFVVNTSKTYVEGPFRESCGKDYFRGKPVRAVYIKRLRTAQDTYVAINTLNRWSARSGIPLVHTVGALRASVAFDAPLVPPDEDDTAGIHVPLTMARVKSGVFGVRKYRKDAPIPIGYRITGTSWRDAQVNEEKLPASSQVGRRINHAGLLIAFLGGYIDGWTGAVSLRNDMVRYQTKHCITPCWDYFPTEDVSPTVECRPNRLCDIACFADWSSAVQRNLSYTVT